MPETLQSIRHAIHARFSPDMLVKAPDEVVHVVEAWYTVINRMIHDAAPVFYRDYQNLNPERIHTILNFPDFSHNRVGVTKKEVIHATLYAAVDVHLSRPYVDTLAEVCVQVGLHPTAAWVTYLVDDRNGIEPSRPRITVVNAVFDAIEAVQPNFVRLPALYQQYQSEDVTRAQDH